MSFALIVATPLVADAAAVYEILDLGAPGGTISYAYGINNAGQVVGNVESSTPGGAFYAFRTAPNSPINQVTSNLGSLVPGQNAYASAINSLGQVTGVSYLASFGPIRAFRTAPNAPINPATDNLGALGSGNSQGNALNDAGQVVGTSTTANNAFTHPFRTAPGAPINPATDDLNAAGGDSFANAINAAGQVAGSAGHAFRTAPNAPLNTATDDLGTLYPPAQSYLHVSQAFGINASGRVVGFSDSPAGGVRAFRTAPNSPIDPATDDLGLVPGTNNSFARAINTSGQVVGDAYFFTLDGGTTFQTAFVYDGANMIDLNSVLYQNPGWHLTRANGINDAGQIVGWGTNPAGQTHAYLLTPVPEPGSACVLACAATSALLPRRRRTRPD